MDELKIVDAYGKNDKQKIETFKNNMRSTLHVNSLYDKIETNFEWLDIMEDTIRYLDNILRNPNRFIVNEEDIVKIELARRITVESIKHLSRNTNFIQDIDKNGEVRPSKILNINKDESFNTYENRLVYTLINRAKEFVAIKKKENVTTSSLKDFKKLEYRAKSEIGSEKININLVIDSKFDTKKQNGESEGLTVDERIAKLEADFSMLTNTEVYKDLAKKNVSYIIPPIKKTNVILKNVNFQYAMKLWTFLQENMEFGTKRIKKNKNYEDFGILKEYINDTFLLDYVALSTLETEKKEEIIDESTREEMTNNLIERIVELNTDLPEEKLKEFIGEKLIVAKMKKSASLSEIQNSFSKQIKKYLEKIENFRFEGGNV